MKIVIAPDSFKDCLTAKEVAETVSNGIHSVFPDAECVQLPVADGGEGTMQVLCDATGGKVFNASVMGPLGKAVEAKYAVLGGNQTGVVEMAQASGLELIPSDKRDPLITTSFGTGQLISKVLEHGISKLIVAIGGSACNDGGIGMLQALGVSFVDAENNEVGLGGGQLKHICRIDSSQLDSRLKDLNVVVACDVNNPLTGPYGASVIFGPQKGASIEVVNELESGMQRYANLLNITLDRDVSIIPGAGAAGGLGAALIAFLDASLEPGINIVLDAVELQKHLEGAALVITGEGRLDAQSIHGKTPVGVSKLALKNGIKTVAIAGSVGDDVDTLKDVGIVGAFSVTSSPMTLEQALSMGKKNVFETAKNIAELLVLTKSNLN